MFGRSTLDSINRTHGLALRKGHIVTIEGRDGRVVGVEGVRIKILLEGDKKPGLYNPGDHRINYASYIKHARLA